MRVCIIRNSEGATNAQLARIATALSKTNNDFFFVTRTRETERQSCIEHKEIEIEGNKYENIEIQIPSIIGGGIKNLIPLIKYTNLLHKWLVQNHDKYDAIHAIDYDTGSVAMKITKKYNKILVYHIADFYADSRLNIPNILKKYLRKKEYEIINYADATIICTDERKEQIEGSSPNKLQVIHNTPPRQQKEFKINPQFNNEILKITYIGGLEKKRFIDQTINVLKDNPNYHLTLAGPVGDARESLDNVVQIDNIDFLGAVSYEKALQLYDNTDIMFAIYDPNHSNHKYSAPNKVYEAMLLGKPIIVAKNTGMDKIVSTEDMGYIIEFNQNDLGELLDYISQNKDELINKSKNAYQAYKKYSWEEMEKRIIELYKNVH